MADLKKVLGTMLVSGLAGRTGGRGAALATAAPMLLGGGTNKAGMSLGKKAGLAALAYLAYKAWNDSGNAQQQSTPAAPPEKTGASGPFGALFDALGVFQPKTEGAAAAASGRIARHGRCSGAAFDPRHDRRRECRRPDHPG